MLSTIMQCVFLLALAATSLTKPLAFTPRDAVSPPITSPKAGTVWRSGETQRVTWDLSALEGTQPSNPLSKIILGTFVDGQEHLFSTSPIAKDFSIFAGNVTLVVPSVPTGSDYIVCLFGSSGNISPAFTIIGSESSASSPFSLSTKVAIASSSNTLPPHQTTDSSTTVSLPSGATQTDPAPSSTTAPSSAPSSSSTSSLSVSIPSGALPSGASPTSPSPSTSSSGTSTATGAGNSGSKTSVTNAHLWSAFWSALALWAAL